MDPKDLQQLIDELEARPLPTPPATDVVNGAVRSPDGRFGELSGRRFYADGTSRLSRDNLYMLVDKAHAFLAAIAGGDTAVSLIAVEHLRRQLDRIEHEVIAVARSQRWSWRQIAEVLGRHASTVHRRFACVDVRARQRRTPWELQDFG